MTAVQFTIVGDPLTNMRRDSVPLSARVMLTGPIRVTVRVFYASPDVHMSGAYVSSRLQPRYSHLMGKRVLEDAGVFLSPHQVKEEHIFHRVDKANPRAEIEVVQLVPEALDLELREVEA